SQGGFSHPRILMEARAQLGDPNTAFADLGFGKPNVLPGSPNILFITNGPVGTTTVTPTIFVNSFHPNDSTPNRQAIISGTSVGDYHDFRMVINDWQTIEYYVDEVLYQTHTYATPVFTQPAYLWFFVDNYENRAIYMDWMRVVVYEGSYVSCAQDAGQVVNWGAFSWLAQKPDTTTLAFRTRTSLDGFTWSPWSDPLTSTGAAVSNPSGRYLQYKAELSTSDTLLSPKIEQVSIQYFGPNSLVVSPATATLNPLTTQPFSAQVYDSNSQPIDGLSYTWQVVNGGGVIDNTGLFTAAINDDTYTHTIQASSAGVTDTATVIVNNLSPQAAAGGTYGPISETFSLELNGTTSTDPNGDPLVYAWDLDNNGLYNDAFTHTITYSWNEPGLHSVGLIVTDTLGLTDTTSANVNVTNLLPIAVITAPLSAEGGQVITFDASPSGDPGGGPLQFNWDFDNDGFFDDGVGAVLDYRFRLLDSHLVLVRVSDNQGGQAVAAFTIQINSNATDAYGVYLPIVRK
ncbi:MAG: hypothetical protein HC875_39515, partial [Anaerolineales bacterium]|nr:hypothetical protein [Anaerolineales bacterium]